jgi:HAD superfamily hydrolase (TIGR01549 family)
MKEGSHAGLPEPNARGKTVAAALLDVDGTLYHQPLLRLFMLGELLASPIRLCSFRRAWSIIRIISAFRKVREELRLVTPGSVCLQELQFELTASRTGVSCEEAAAVIDEWIFTRPLKYLRVCRRAGLAAAIDDLQAAGIRLGVFSDYPVFDKLRALGVEHRFSPCLSATDPEVNAFKPDPKGFLYACDIFGLQPAEVVYVGDRPDVDAEGAVAAGLSCVIISSGLPAVRKRGRVGAYKTVGSLRRLVHAIINTPESR